MTYENHFIRARKVNTMINDIRVVIDIMSDQWPLKSDVEMDGHFEAVEKYLQKKIEEIQLTGEA